MSTGKGREERPAFDTKNPPTAESRPSCCVCEGTTFKTDQGVKVNIFNPAEEEPALFVKTSAENLRGHNDPVAYLMDRVCCRRCWLTKGRPQAHALSDVLSDLGVTGLRRFTALAARQESPRAVPTPALSESRPVPAPALPKTKPTKPSRVEQFERRYGGVSSNRQKTEVTVASSGPRGSQLGSDPSQRWTLADHPALRGLRSHLQKDTQRQQCADKAEQERQRREAEAVMIAEGRATVLPDNTVVPRLKRRRPRPQKRWRIKLKGVNFVEGKRGYPRYGVDVESFGASPVEVPRDVEPLRHIASGEVSAGVKMGSVAAFRHPATAVCELDDGDRMASLVLGLMAHDKEPFATPGEAYSVVQTIGFDRFVALWNAVIDCGLELKKLEEERLRREKEIATPARPPADEAATSGDNALSAES